jgi:anti-sigma regulatory factor (Ser/Thr protein kinase)
VLTAGRVVPRDHAVAFYDHDADLVACLADFVDEGLRLDEGVLVVATPVHREALAQVLAQRGLQVEALQAAGRYVAVDAAETLQTFLVDGSPAALPFAVTAGALLDRAGAGGRPVRAFGEMVALLWAQGDVVPALELEALWNDLARTRRFLLLCAYPAATLTHGDELAPLAVVCHEHSALLAPSSYSSEVVVLGRPDGVGGRTETFVPVPEAIRMVRRFLRCTLRAWHEDALVADAELVVSELATNAIRHARSPFRVSLARDDATVRVSVEDLGAGLPREIGQSLDGVSGRGIALVSALTVRWGIARGEDGKTVWAELALLRSGAATR